MLTVRKIDTLKDLRRKKIIDSASELFSRKNYHEVMMDDVAKLASIAKGTVYNYFSSKEELYFSIMRMRMDKLTSLLREKIQFDMNSINSLRSFILQLYMFMMKYQNFFLMYQKEYLKQDNELCGEFLELQKDLENILSGILTTGKIEKLFKKDIEEEFTVDLILGSIYGAVKRGIDRKMSEQEKKTEREKVFDFILNGLSTGFNYMEHLPLRNKIFVMTRAVEQSKESAEIFTRLGADVIVFPTLDIVPPASWKLFDDAITKTNKIDFLVFTSTHSVTMFLKRCKELDVAPDYNQIKIAAVGNKTALICARNNLKVDIVPSRFSSEGLISELNKYNLIGKVVFIPRSEIGREELPEGLKELGAVIKSVPAYNVSLPSKEILEEPLKKLNESKPELYIFTSPSTFENFIQILGIINPQKFFAGYDVAAIGPTTRSAIENRNVKVNIMPDEYTIDGLSKAIVEYYKHKQEKF